MLRAWLYRIATNVCLDELKDRKSRPLPSDVGPPGDPAVDPVPPETTLFPAVVGTHSHPGVIAAWALATPAPHTPTPTISVNATRLLHNTAAVLSRPAHVTGPVWTPDLLESWPTL